MGHVAFELEEQGVSDSPVRRPKIVDVARAAGVSPTTVSHALNQRGQVDPRTRERVIEVFEERRPATSEDLRELRTELRRISRRLAAIERRLEERDGDTGEAPKRTSGRARGAS